MNKVKYFLILLMTTCILNGCGKGDVNSLIEEHTTTTTTTNDNNTEDMLETDLSVSENDTELNNVIVTSSEDTDKNLNNIKSLLNDGNVDNNQSKSEYSIGYEDIGNTEADDVDSEFAKDLVDTIEQITDMAQSGINIIYSEDTTISGEDAYDLVHGVGLYNSVCADDEVIPIVIIPAQFVTEYEDNIIMSNNTVSYFGICCGYPICNDSNEPIYINWSAGLEPSTNEHGAKDLYDRYSYCPIGIYIIKIDTTVEPFGTKVDNSALWFNVEKGCYIGSAVRDGYDRVGVMSVISGYYKPTEGSPIEVNKSSTYGKYFIIDEEENFIGVVLQENFE